MKISDLIAMCARNLTRRKFRTFLTVMGVVIGTCSIVVMISLGVGISASQEELLANLGDLTIINVSSRGSSAEAVLDDDAVLQMQNMSGVLVATPFMYYNPANSWMQLFAGRKDRYQGWFDVIGIKSEALEILGYTMAEGETLNQKDDKTIQLIMGNKFAYYFDDTKRTWPNSMVDAWPDENGNIADPFFNPLETPFKFKIRHSKEDAKDLEFDAVCVGIIASGEYEYEKFMSAFMDIDQMKRIKKAYEKENGIKKDKNKIEQYNDVKVKVEDIKLIKQVQADIEAMGFRCDSMEQYREEMQKSTNQVQLILAILGGVSLFVAAISITNTMIMSVYERTREIGVMKVLGCLVGNIRTMFLVEAGLIGLIGGIIGIGLSYLLSFLLNTFGGSLGQMLGMGMMGGESKVSIIPPWLVLLGLVFSTLIGVISGFQPANRAVKISALEAIKTE